VRPRFAEVGLPADLVDSLAARGVTTPFEIQAKVIPVALAGHDVCGCAPTGSGKTLAFGLPIALRVPKAKPRRPTALILAPTRELALQITAELTPLLRLRGRTIAAFYGGVGFGAQLKSLQRGVDVAVACPGRLADLLRRSSLVLDDVGIAVVDEADRMADMGFLPEVRRILDAVRRDRQTMLFSATLDGAVDVLVKRYQREPVRCDVKSPTATADPNTHHFLKAARQGRLAMTLDLVVEHGSTVVFCRTKHGADRVAKQLTSAGVSAVAIHGNRSQAQRERALAAFSSGRAQALVATDVAARGIHVDDVACVVHFDVPTDAKDYVHRSGRTGRAGASGVVVTFVTDEDRDKVRTLQTSLGLGSPSPARKRSRPRRVNDSRHPPRRANPRPRR
jgi:superfamily II DNA/RNA helicase